MNCLSFIVPISGILLKQVFGKLLLLSSATMNKHTLGKEVENWGKEGTVFKHFKH